MNPPRISKINLLLYRFVREDLGIALYLHYLHKQDNRCLRLEEMLRDQLYEDEDP